MRPPDPKNGGGAGSHRRLTKTDTAEGHREFIAWSPLDEARPQLRAVITNLKYAMNADLPLVSTVESSITALERIEQFLAVA